VVVPITYPDGSGNRFQSVHDVFGDGGPRAKEFRDKLEERVAEADDALLERYLETGTLDPQAVLDNLAAAVTRGKLVPLFVVSPPKMLGVEQLLARLPSMLPSPIAYGPRAVATQSGGAADQLLPPDPDGPFAARVFRVVVDPYVGRLAHLRRMRGHLPAEEGFPHERPAKHEHVGSLPRRNGH